MVRTKLNALHTARKSFIRKAVYYRRQNSKEWHGPNKVLGKESHCVLIRHGRAFYREHPFHLMKAKKEFGSPRNKGKNWESQGMKEIKLPKMR